jgi:hypothetical protein
LFCNKKEWIHLETECSYMRERGLLDYILQRFRSWTSHALNISLKMLTRMVWIHSVTQIFLTAHTERRRKEVVWRRSRIPLRGLVPVQSVSC